MYCPQCGKKFWFRNTFCPECRVGLVQHPPMSPAVEEEWTGGQSAEQDPMEEPATEEATAEHRVHTDPQPTRVFASENPALIALAHSLLEENGIECLTKTDVMNGLGVGSGWEEFWVRADEAQLASDVLRDLIQESPPPLEPSPGDER